MLTSELKWVHTCSTAYKSGLWRQHLFSSLCSIVTCALLQTSATCTRDHSDHESGQQLCKILPKCEIIPLMTLGGGDMVYTTKLNFYPSSPGSLVDDVDKVAVTLFDAADAACVCCSEQQSQQAIQGKDQRRRAGKRQRWGHFFKKKISICFISGEMLKDDVIALVSAVILNHPLHTELI